MQTILRFILRGMHRTRFPAVVKLLCLSHLRLQQSILALTCCGYCQGWPCKPLNCQVFCYLFLSVSDFSFGCHVFHASDPGQAPHVTIAQKGGGWGASPHSSAPLRTFVDLVFLPMCFSCECSQRTWPSPTCHHHSWGLLAHLQLASPSSYT